jgi:hypothetical protein
MCYWKTITGEPPRQGAEAETSSPGEVDAGEWVRERLGLDPDETQMRMLRTPRKNGLLNCTRQWGKSTVAAAKAVHEAWTRAESLVLVVSPSGRQSGEFVRKAAAFGRRLGIKTKGDGDNAISLEFPNRSRIVGLPGIEATARGFSAVSLLVVDEASRVDDDTYLALRPMLATSGGSLWLLSTPFGKRGFFWQEWEHGGPGWERIRATAYECPRIPRDFLEGEKASMGEKWFRQEYLCEFVDTVEGVFDRDLVDAAVSAEFEPLMLGQRGLR